VSAQTLTVVLGQPPTKLVFFNTTNDETDQSMTFLLLPGITLDLAKSNNTEKLLPTLFACDVSS
jgi:hypothetical protein